MERFHHVEKLTEEREKNQQRERQIHDGRASRDRAEWQLYLRLAGTHPGTRKRTDGRLGTWKEELTWKTSF